MDTTNDSVDVASQSDYAVDFFTTILMLSKQVEMCDLASHIVFTIDLILQLTYLRGMLLSYTWFVFDGVLD